MSCIVRDECRGMDCAGCEFNIEPEDELPILDPEALKAIEYLRKYPPEQVAAYMKSKGYT